MKLNISSNGSCTTTSMLKNSKLNLNISFLEKDLKNLEFNSKPKANRNTTTLNTLAGYRNKLFK
jgi:hypothetical protein